jgi:phosphoglycolate phosphatase
MERGRGGDGEVEISRVSISPSPRVPESPCHNIQAVLFDLDGTLVHLNIDFRKMRMDVEAILPRYGLSMDGKASRYTLELIAECAQALTEQSGGGELATAFQRDAEAAIVAVEMGAAETAEVHPGVSEFLERLRQRGIKVGIVTRNCRAAVERILNRSTLVYDVLLTRDDVEAVKPDPGHLLAALRLLQVEPRQALMVGDHPMDVRAGRAVGAKTVAVLTGYSPAERFAPEKPDLILKQVGELETYLVA